MARIEKLSCDNCGASLDVDLDQMVIECKFCGTKLILEQDNKGTFSTGIISKKHIAEVQQWFDKLGIHKEITMLEFVDSLDLKGKEIDFPDLKYLEYLPNLTILDLRESNINDHGTAYLRPVTSIELLNICNTAVSDLSFTANMGKMKTIYADETKIEDKGLAEINGLNSLKTLSIVNNNITDLGLKSLVNLKNLVNLNLEGTLVTADGLRLFKGNKNLKKLSYPSAIHAADMLKADIMELLSVKSIIGLLGRGITDDDLKKLEGIGRIEILDLSRNKITDKGVEELEGHRYLNDLDLSYNKLTDSSISQLAGFKRLKSLDVRGNRISDKGIDKLRELMPGVKVYG